MTMMSEGDCFNSFDELSACISELEVKTNTKFFKSSSVTLGKFLQSSPGHFISKAVAGRPDKDVVLKQKKYRSVKFACTHGGRQYQSKVGDDRVRNTRTKKVGCPVNIHVFLDKSLRLVIGRISLQHSHPVSRATFLLQPENRRLTEDAKEVARRYHAVGADKRRIRQHLQDSYGRTLTRHDLNNILRDPKSEDSDLEATISLLSERGFRSTVVEDAGTVCGLFFQDLEMQSAFEKFPELLLMDSTYKLVDIRTPVFTILTVDSFGRGVPLAVFLVTCETSQMIGAMLQVFREHNDAAANNTKVWLTDKDRAERSAIAEVFPDCDLFLCSFHVLQSFRREVDLTGLDKAERERVLRTLQQLVFAPSDNEYSRLRGEIRHPATDRYLRDNWDDIKGEWVRGLSGADMAGVFTNNHLESLHGKLKSVCKMHDPLPKFVLSYLVVLHTVRADRNAEIHAETNKRPTSSCHGELAEYQRHVTSFALSLLQDQLVQAASVTLDVSLDGQQTACDGSGVVAVSPTDCSCLFYRHYAMPCRHIMAVRQDRQMRLFSQDLIAQKWLLSYAAGHLEAQVTPWAPTNPSVSTRRLPQAAPPRTERERFRRLQTITAQIASVGSELTGHRHQDLAEKLSLVLEYLQQDRSFVIIEEVDAGAATDVLIQPTGDKEDDGSARVRPCPRPCFDLTWDETSQSPVRPRPDHDHMLPSPNPVTPTPLMNIPMDHRTAVPSPLTRTAPPGLSRRMAPRYAVPSPSRKTPTSSPRTPKHRLHHPVSERTVIPSPSSLVSRTMGDDFAIPSPVISGPITKARRNLWSPKAYLGIGSQSSHAARSPSPSLVADSHRLQVVGSPSPSPVIGGYVSRARTCTAVGSVPFAGPSTSGGSQLVWYDGAASPSPSPVIGGHLSRARTLAAVDSVSFAGPSTSGAPRLAWRDRGASALSHLTMPPRVTKNRGRPKGSATTVVGSTKK